MDSLDIEKDLLNGISYFKGSICIFTAVSCCFLGRHNKYLATGPEKSNALYVQG